MANFSEKRAIGYTLMSDVGSKVIRELGLLNVHIAQQQNAFGVRVSERHLGVPYPGTFVLDEAGVVRERWFEQSYRVRPTAVTFLEESFHIENLRAGVRATSQSDRVRASVWLGGSTYHPHQRLSLNVELNIAAGLHVYTDPIPDGYVPLSIEIEPVQGMQIGEIKLPEPQQLHLETLDETFHVFEGRVRGRLPVVLTHNVGDVQLALRVGYQTCSDRECFMPEVLTLTLPVRAEDNIRD